MSYLPRSLSYTFHFCFDCAISISIFGEMVVLQMIFLAIFSTQWYMSKAVYQVAPELLIRWQHTFYHIYKNIEQD